MFVDVEPDTFNVDVDAIEAMIGPQTRAILMPNLAGNAPDWDRIRAVADRHGLSVIEDSCDALGARLRGTPTGTRSDISVTSFALSHIITCAGNGGMVMLDDDALVDRCLSLRRWGRRSEPQLFGSRKGDRNFWEDLDGIRYDNLFIFDDVGWNFEPSEIGAAFGLAAAGEAARQLRTRRQRSFELYSEFLGRLPGPLRRAAHDRRSSRPRGSRTCSSCTPTPASARSDLQAFLEQRRHRDADRVDGQRGPPADDARRAVPSARRRTPERRRGDGAGHARPDESRARRTTTSRSSATGSRRSSLAAG